MEIFTTFLFIAILFVLGVIASILSDILEGFKELRKNGFILINEKDSCKCSCNCSRGEDNV